MSGWLYWVRPVHFKSNSKFFQTSINLFHKLSRHYLGPGECSTRRLMLIRQEDKKWHGINQDLWKSRKSTPKSQFSKWRFEWLGVLRSTSQLQVDLKIFSDVEIFFYKLLRHCPGPGECSAHRFMVIGHVEKKNFKHVKFLTCASLINIFWHQKIVKRL